MDYLDLTVEDYLDLSEAEYLSLHLDPSEWWKSFTLKQWDDFTVEDWDEFLVDRASPSTEILSIYKAGATAMRVFRTTTTAQSFSPGAAAGALA